MYVHLCLDDMDCATIRIIVREKTNKMQQLDVYYQHFFNIFRASLCPSSGDQNVCYACGVLHWFCWMWLVAVVGRCVVGCEDFECYCSNGTVTFTVETCSSRFKIGNISDCYIYNFILCYWFFSYLTTTFLTESEVIKSFLLHFRNHH